MDDQQPPATRAEEIKVFVFFAIVLAPVLAIMTVGGYGFFVWMYQLLTGTLPSH